MQKYAKGMEYVKASSTAKRKGKAIATGAVAFFERTDITGLVADKRECFMGQIGVYDLARGAHRDELSVGVADLKNRAVEWMEHAGTLRGGKVPAAIPSTKTNFGCSEAEVKECIGEYPLKVSKFCLRAVLASEGYPGDCRKIETDRTKLLNESSKDGGRSDESLRADLCSHHGHGAELGNVTSGNNWILFFDKK